DRPHVSDSQAVPSTLAPRQRRARGLLRPGTALAGEGLRAGGTRARACRATDRPRDHDGRPRGGRAEDARASEGARDRAAAAARMLELKSVRAGYGTFQALFDVSLEVHRGEAVGVIGPNGAGKTTLMRVVSGLIRPTSGTLVMEGVDLAATPAHRIVELGVA